jgi:hypothetical protein
MCPPNAISWRTPVTRHSALLLRRPNAIHLLAALTIFTLLVSHAAALEFFAEADGDDLRITDNSGATVTVLTGDPIGSRPNICLPGQFYFNQLDSDKAQVVLTDCATNRGNYPIQILSN